jgi:YfiH family protein
MAGSVITYASLNKYNEIAHFCTSREGGVSVGNYASWNLSPFSGDKPECFNENKLLLCNKLGIDSEKLIIPFQTHGTEVREIDDDFFQFSTVEKANYLNGIDAIFTKLPNVCVSVTTADCVPLLFFDPTKKVIAAAHAGWRGTCGRIAEKTIHALVERFDCKPNDILVTIGPSISSNVYEVGSEVVDAFKLAEFETSKIVDIRNHSIFLDLWQANRQVLERVGVLPQNIEISGICTYTEHERFFSARRLGLKSGRILSGIMLK